MGGICAPSHPSASRSHQHSAPSDQMLSFREGGKNWLIRVGAARESQDEVFKGDPVPGTLNPPSLSISLPLAGGTKAFPPDHSSKHSP